MKMTGTVLAAVALSLYGPWALAQEAPLVWASSYTASPPTIDGAIDEVWSTAEPLTVPLREALGGTEPFEVILRALHTGDTLYILARWPDATRNDMRDPYLWNAETEEYERPTTPDDQFAIEFPLKGALQQNMLPAAGSYEADVWHWKAGRSNLGGWVDDKRHIISQEPFEGGKHYNFGGRHSVYVARPMDEGTAAYKVTPKPSSFEGERVASYEPQPPSGSLADVRGKGVHDGKTWTLEACRKFDTGHADDAVIDPTKPILCAIAVLNDELNWDHSVSQLLELSLRPSKNE